MKILITGCAGFIGYHLTKRLVNEGHEVVGIDNMNSLLYTDKIKFNRLSLIPSHNFTFFGIDLCDKLSLKKIFDNFYFTKIIHLAAVPGVRYSLENPESNIINNILGFSNIIQLAIKYNIQHFIYASSSSVYGQTASVSFKEYENTDFPRSIYGATKKCNEILAHAFGNYSFLNTTGLRFFTVYGPWGRPDMAYYLFAKKIMDGDPITIFGDKNIFRDFTYIDDIINGICKIIFTRPINCGIYNLGRGEPVNLRYFIGLIENELGKKAIKEYEPLPIGDVTRTSADMHLFNSLFDFKPRVSIIEGIKKFIRWFKDYHDC